MPWILRFSSIAVFLLVSAWPVVRAAAIHRGMAQPERAEGRVWERVAIGWSGIVPEARTNRMIFYVVCGLLLPWMLGAAVLLAFSGDGSDAIGLAAPLVVLSLAARAFYGPNELRVSENGIFWKELHRWEELADYELRETQLVLQRGSLRVEIYIPIDTQRAETLDRVVALLQQRMAPAPGASSVAR